MLTIINSWTKGAGTEFIQTDNSVNKPRGKFTVKAGTAGVTGRTLFAYGAVWVVGGGPETQRKIVIMG